MNVSNSAYFTSEYLDKKGSRSPRYMPSRSDIRHMPSPQENSARNSPVPRSAPESPDHLDEVITPAQLNYLHKSRQRAPVDYNAYYTRKYRHSEPRHNRHKTYLYDDDDDDDASSFRTDDLDSIIEHQKTKPYEFNGYYIDQQRRYDAARDLKPKMFTHKAFMDVFEKDKDDRISPADVVFTNREAADQQPKQRKKFSEAMKKFQKKLGANDYESIDYFSNKRTEKKNDQDLFVDTVSDDSDVDSPSQVDHTPNKKLRRAMKKKWQGAKRAVGEDYYENYQRALATKERKKLVKANKTNAAKEENNAYQSQEDLGSMSHNSNQEDLWLQPSEEPSVKPMNKGKEGTGANMGPNERFHPLWNYMLSWLVYERDQQNSQNSSGKIVELDNGDNHSGDSLQRKDLVPAKKGKNRKRKLQGLKNYKALVLKWNLPASAVFDGGYPQTQNMGGQLSSRSTIGSVSTHPEMTYPEYLELSEDDLGDELLYNAEEGTHGPYIRSPPTSADAMLVKNETIGGRLHEGGPTKIISNINQLIKSIKIMKIVFAPIDVIAENFPSTQTFVILLELLIFVWMLYELSLLIDALCMAVKAVCAPMIAVGRFMNRIM